MRRAIIGVLTLLSISGCAAGAPTTWVKSGASGADLARDKYACTQESRVGDVAGTDETRAFFYGQNKLSQTEANRLYSMCLQARGWTAAR